MRTERTAGVVRVGGMMAVATLVSRVTGFVAKVGA
jgi:putative peptidoglycan lipid II flippase